MRRAEAAVVEDKVYQKGFGWRVLGEPKGTLVTFGYLGVL
jgi:hypothetical protein